MPTTSTATPEVVAGTSRRVKFEDEQQQVEESNEEDAIQVAKLSSEMPSPIFFNFIVFHF
jgi:hypothetical protein